MSGVDIRTVAELLGHKSGLRMTMRYSHLSPQHKMDAVNRLSEKFGERTDVSINNGFHPQVDLPSVPRDLLATP
jgi:hypothetical protein